jgi:hypothetical protein
LDKSQVEKEQKEYVTVMTEIGLPPKKSKIISPSCRGVEILGLVLNGTDHTLGLDPSKLSRLMEATLAVLRSGKISGHGLSTLLGKWTWACLSRRPSFAVFSAVYRFIAMAGGSEHNLWPSVRNGLLAIIALAPLLVASLTCRWLEYVIATDASLTGMGVVISRYNPATLTSPGNYNWSTIISSRWKFPEHINSLECRAVNTAVKWVLSRPCGLNSTVVILSDSSVVVGAVSKGRSSSYQILTRLRSLSAMILAAGIRLDLRWIPSNDNPADYASRQ